MTRRQTELSSPSHSGARLSRQVGEQRGAGRLAAAAGLGADPAVFVHPGMLLALVRAGGAGGAAGLDEAAHESRVGLSAAGEDPSGGGADVGAVQVGRDAPAQLGDHLLGQARVRAGGAGLGALEAGLDAFGELLLVDGAEVLRVGLKH